MISLAHYFTFLRIFLIPFFPIIYIGYRDWGIPAGAVPFLLLILLTVCELTDLIDGFIARRRNQVTDLGKVMDPVADSVMRISVFLTFTQEPLSLPLLLVLVFIYREFCITALRILCALRGYALAARKAGKIKAILQAAVSFEIVFLMIAHSQGLISLELFRKISLYSLSVVAVYTVLSAVDYIRANKLYILESLRIAK